MVSCPTWLVSIDSSRLSVFSYGNVVRRCSLYGESLPSVVKAETSCKLDKSLVVYRGQRYQRVQNHRRNISRVFLQRQLTSTTDCED